MSIYKIMRVYNLYYKQQRINKKPLSKEEAEKIRSMKTINKVISKDEIEEIPVDRIRFVECVIF